MEALNALAQGLDPEVQAILEAGLQDHTAQALAAAAQAANVEFDEVDHNALRRFKKLHPHSLIGKCKIPLIGCMK